MFAFNIHGAAKWMTSNKWNEFRIIIMECIYTRKNHFSYVFFILKCEYIFIFENVPKNR